MKRAVVVTVFSLDVDRAEELLELVTNLGIALQVRGIDSLIEFKEVDLPEPASAERKAAAN